MEHPYSKRRLDPYTEDRVYELLKVGLKTAIEIDYYLSSAGDRRHRATTSDVAVEIIDEVLVTLERRGEVSRDIGVGLRGSDHWFITGYISDGPCPNDVECGGGLRVVMSDAFRLRCDACGARFVENQSFATQSERDESRQIDRLGRQQIARLLGRPVTEKQVVS